MLKLISKLNWKKLVCNHVSICLRTPFNDYKQRQISNIFRNGSQVPSFGTTTWVAPTQRRSDASPSCTPNTPTTHWWTFVFFFLFFSWFLKALDLRSCYLITSKIKFLNTWKVKVQAMLCWTFSSTRIQKNKFLNFCPSTSSRILKHQPQRPFERKWNRNKRSFMWSLRTGSLSKA